MPLINQGPWNACGTEAKAMMAVRVAFGRQVNIGVRSQQLAFPVPGHL